MANTTTSVVQISVTEESGKTKTFNLDNPKENLSLNEIRQKLQPAFEGRWWLGNDGTAITTLKSANYSQSVKIPIEGQDAVIEVTPSIVEFSPTSTSITEVQETVQVTGSELVGAYITGFEATTSEYLAAQAYAELNQVAVFGSLARISQTREATLSIVTAARTVTIPIKVYA